MLNSLLDLGLTSIIKINSATERRTSAPVTRQSLNAYPRLMMALNHAERSGLLASERRRLVGQRACR